MNRNEVIKKISDECAAALKAENDKPSVRRGWRHFHCSECEHRWKLPSRDALSPRWENCPRCGDWCHSYNGEIDATIPCDDLGNLTVPWDWTGGTQRAGTWVSGLVYFVIDGPKPPITVYRMQPNGDIEMALDCGWIASSTNQQTGLSELPEGAARFIWERIFLK